jgi:hypothetical protein
MNGFKPNAKMGNTGHYAHGGAVAKKATGGEMNAKRIANPNMPRPMPGPRKPMVDGPLGPRKPMVDGPLSPRKPNGPRPQTRPLTPRDNGTPLGPDDRPLGMPKPKAGGVMGSPVKPMGGIVGNGPFGPRNPNGPRKPMGSPSPMSGGLSSMFKGPMARKKGGMAKGMK